MRGGDRQPAMTIDPSMSAVRPCPRCGASASEEILAGLCSRCVAISFLEPEGQAAVPGAPEQPVAATSVVGDYELLEPVARGGMGLVYKARQRSLNRVVAVKMIAGGALADPTARLRLRQEGEAAAALRHPNIVAIHEIGEHAGQPFISMDFVAGPTLAQLARPGPLPAARAARIVRTLAGAVQYAHERGIIHRDLKPSNVLLDEDGEPRITDFGLARQLDSQVELTLTGQVLGSPNFLSPEQASGRRENVGVASDVYGLGAILYFLLAARPPFVAETVEAALAQVQGADPVSPRLLNGSVPRDLETIVLQCLEKEPARRYPSARRLAEELGRFLRDEPILARPANRAHKTWRWCRRKPVLASLAAVTALLVLGVSIGAPLAAWRIERERQRAESNARAAGRLAATERENLYAADMLLTQQALETGNLSHALELLERHRPASKVAAADDPRGWEWRHYWQQTRGDERFTLGRADHSVLTMAYAPDGRSLVTGSQSGEVLRWDLDRRMIGARARHTERVDALAFSPDGQELATGGSDGVVKLLALAGLELQREIRSAAGSRALVFTASGEQLFGVGVSQWARWSLGTGGELERGNATSFARATISPDTGLMAWPQANGEVWVLGTSAGSEIKRFGGHTGFVLPVVFSRDGKRVASGGFDGVAQVYDLAAGKVVARLAGHHGVVSALAFTPDGRTLATASYDGAIKLWDTSNWQERVTLRGHLHPIWALAISPDGEQVATGDKHGVIKVWSTRGAAPPPLPDRIGVSRYSRDGTTVITGEAGGEWQVWDMRQTPVARPLRAGTNGQFRAVHPSDAGFALETLTGELLAWRPDASTGRTIIMPAGMNSAPLDASFFGAGKYACLRDGNNRLRLVEIPAGRAIELQPSPAGLACIIAVPSRDGARLLLAGGRNELSLYDTATGRLLATRPPERFTIATAAFASDGRWLVTGGEDGVVRRWETPGLKLLSELRTGADAYWSVAISPDDRRVAAGTAHGTVAMWDVASGREVARLRARLPGMVLDLVFGADGNNLVSGNTLTIWRAATMAEIEAARGARSDF